MSVKSRDGCARGGGIVRAVMILGVVVRVVVVLGVVVRVAMTFSSAAIWKELAREEKLNNDSQHIAGRECET